MFRLILHHARLQHHVADKNSNFHETFKQMAPGRDGRISINSKACCCRLAALSQCIL